ncbi:hypothetical protein C8R44DRAFT_810128 [Mycena epipterygia]|nr:hypothetical protein C8R44DRAFT_810128 [Mycena epipterygia]
MLYYQVHIGCSPVRMVVRLTLMFVTGLICNVVVVLIAGRVKTIWLLATGTLTTTITPSSLLSSPSVVGANFLFAAGAVGPGEQSVAGELFQTMTQTSFGVTASTIVFNHVQQGADRNGADALASYHAAMWTGDDSYPQQPPPPPPHPHPNDKDARSGV